MRAETRKERILSMVAAILVLIGGIGAGWSLAWLERQVNKVEITGDSITAETRSWVEWQPDYIYGNVGIAPVEGFPNGYYIKGIK